MSTLFTKKIEIVANNFKFMPNLYDKVLLLQLQSIIKGIIIFKF